jgi:3-oxoacyl-[acyl-carrier protein] reductase
MADDDEAWRVSFNVDMMPAVRASRKVIPWMAKNGGGSIVHISSGSGRMAGSPPAYAALKAALISHSKTLAVALAPQRIRVNAIALARFFSPTAFGNVRLQNRAMYDAVLASIPSGRFGNPEEVANAVVFLSSPKASWITGALLGVDGGQYPANA